MGDRTPDGDRWDMAIKSQSPPEGRYLEKAL
jgi:hypothetical protein